MAAGLVRLSAYQTDFRKSPRPGDPTPRDDSEAWQRMLDELPPVGGTAIIDAPDQAHIYFRKPLVLPRYNQLAIISEDPNTLIEGADLKTGQAMIEWAEEPPNDADPVEHHVIRNLKLWRRNSCEPGSVIHYGSCKDTHLVMSRFENLVVQSERDDDDLIVIDYGRFTTIRDCRIEGGWSSGTGLKLAGDHLVIERVYAKPKLWAPATFLDLDANNSTLYHLRTEGGASPYGDYYIHDCKHVLAIALKSEGHHSEAIALVDGCYDVTFDTPAIAHLVERSGNHAGLRIKKSHHVRVRGGVFSDQSRGGKAVVFEPTATDCTIDGAELDVANQVDWGISGCWGFGHRRGNKVINCYTT